MLMKYTRIEIMDVIGNDTSCSMYTSVERIAATHYTLPVYLIPVSGAVDRSTLCLCVVG